MNLLRSIVIGSSLVALACANGHQTPVSPTRSLIGLALGQQSVVVGRNHTAALQLTASYSDGSTENVTSAATWSTSDGSVVRVDAGVVTAVGIGHATVRAEFTGRSASSEVTGRRNTTLSGSATAACSPNVAILQGLEAVLDDTQVTRIEPVDDTHGIASVTVSFSDVPVIPGDHELKIKVLRTGFAIQSATPSPTTVTAAPGPRLKIIDADTGQELRVETLPDAQIVVTTSGQFSWRVSVPVFDQ